MTVMNLLRYVRHWGKGSRSPIIYQRAHSSQLVSRALHPDLQCGEDLFKYTEGRFICNEEHELLKRHVRFNVNELARCAAEAVGAKTCVNITKYPDSLYNKTILLTMDNGSRVVAKIPNPSAGLPHLTTASEVATMDFARNVLKMPVPKVLDWRSRAHDNPVGAEYIIMEEVQGIELRHVWPKMGIEDRFTVVKSIAGFEKAWTSVSFTKYGSLYFSTDLKETPGSQPLYVDANGDYVTNDKFTIGPSTARETFDSGRGAVKFDRGPWNSLIDYHLAIGHRELACISQLPELPKPQTTLCGPGTYQPTKAKKLKALQFYLDLVKYLLPADQEISSAHLWHHDLHDGNIFVDPAEPTKVVGVVDWQSIELSPLYFQARQPCIIDYSGPRVNGLEQPELPEDFGTLEPSERNQAHILYLQQSLCSLYNTLTHVRNPRLYAALQFKDTHNHRLLLTARRLLIDGEAVYLARVAELESIWDEISTDPNSPYPFTFSDMEREEIEADFEGTMRGMETMRSIMETLGGLFPQQGVVRTEVYEEALDALSQMKEQVIDLYATNADEREAWERFWPF